MKKKLLIMLLVLSATIGVNAAKAPTFDETKNIFYANGTTVDIYSADHEITSLTADTALQEKIGEVCGEDEDNACTAANASAVIVYGTKYLYVSPKTVIFGGGDGESFDSSHITLNSGSVYDIFGGGKGTTTIGADVDTAVIDLKDGYACSANGGGYLKSTVDDVTINMTGGMVSNVQGGGYASGQSYISSATDSTGTEANPEESLTIVNNATINLSAGRIYDPVSSWGLLVGGGLGYNYVKNTTINIGGTFGNSAANHDVLYIIAGGANGRTDKSIINFEAGYAYTIQTVNRGSVGEVYVNISGGTIDYLYAGGESSDSSVTGVIDDYVSIALTGGTIGQITRGTSAGIAIPVDSELVALYYNSDVVITDEDTFDFEFAQLARFIYDDTRVDVSDNAALIPSEIFKSISDNMLNYAFVKDSEDSDTKYAWEFFGEDIIDPSIIVNPEITVTNTAPEDIASDITSLIPEDTEVLYLDFSHDGVLPGKANITLVLDSDVYEVGQKLYIAHYNETTKKLEKGQEVTVMQESVEDPLVIVFEITECSVYTLTNTNLIPNPNTMDNIIVYLGIATLAIVGIVSLTIRKKYN